MGMKSRNESLKTWFSGASVLISLAALAFSIQANEYSRQAITPKINIENSYSLGSADSGTFSSEPWPLTVTGCLGEIVGSPIYTLILTTEQHFIISNSGGLETTLVAVDFASDLDSTANSDRMWLGWNADMQSNADEGSGEIHRLPTVDVPAGKSIRITGVASERVYFATTADAIAYIDILSKYNLREAGKTPPASQGRWVFTFGNGAKYTFIGRHVSVAKEAHLEENLASLACP